MSYAKQMLETSPNQTAVDADALSELIDSCLDCTQACTTCADACLGEENIQMLGRCIRLDLDCADVCDTTAKILSRQLAFEPEMARTVVEACARAVKLCGDECEEHAEHHEHCRVCMESCRRCEEACNRVLQSL